MTSDANCISRTFYLSQKIRVHCPKLVVFALFFLLCIPEYDVSIWCIAGYDTNQGYTPLYLNSTLSSLCFATYYVYAVCVHLGRSVCNLPI